MTPVIVTPSEAPAVGSLGMDVTEAGRAHYLPSVYHRYTIRVPAPAARSLRVTLKFSQEDAGVAAHIDELDVAAEGADLREAFTNVVGAARAWLEYVRDERPQLAQEIAGQARYVPLLDAPVFSWFKKFDFEH